MESQESQADCFVVGGVFFTYTTPAFTSRHLGHPRPNHDHCKSKPAESQPIIFEIILKKVIDYFSDLKYSRFISSKLKGAKNENLYSL